MRHQPEVKLGDLLPNATYHTGCRYTEGHVWCSEEKFLGEHGPAPWVTLKEDRFAPGS